MRPILHWLTLSLLISASNGVAVSRTLPSSPPTVTLQSGVLEGFFFNADGAAFLGIPYAAPPVGELRWKPPQPVRTWKGSRMATQFGAACPQRPANWFPYKTGYARGVDRKSAAAKASFWPWDCYSSHRWRQHMGQDI